MLLGPLLFWLYGKLVAEDNRREGHLIIIGVLNLFLTAGIATLGIVLLLKLFKF